MKKIFLSALAMAFAVSMTTAATAADATDASTQARADASAPAAANMTVTGTVKSMDKDSGELTVTDSAGKDTELKAKQADLANINEGDTVTAMYSKSGDENIASSVTKAGGTTGGSSGSTGGTTESGSSGGSMGGSKY